MAHPSCESLILWRLWGKYPGVPPWRLGLFQVLDKFCFLGVTLYRLLADTMLFGENCGSTTNQGVKLTL
jgi:hypothetical protein